MKTHNNAQKNKKRERLRAPEKTREESEKSLQFSEVRATRDIIMRFNTLVPSKWNDRRRQPTDNNLSGEGSTPRTPPSLTRISPHQRILAALNKESASATRKGNLCAKSALPKQKQSSLAKVKAKCYITPCIPCKQFRDFAL